MTARPDFGDWPDDFDLTPGRRMGADALSDLLKTVRLSGAAFFEIAADGPWAVGAPAPAMILPKILPDADHLIAYHVVTAGECFGKLAGGEPIAVNAGEVIVFVNADAHVMSSAPTAHADPFTADALEIAAAGRMPYCINYGGSVPATTRLVCGYLACDKGPFNPLLDNLPPVIKAGDPRSRTGWLGQFVQFALAEAAEKRAGSESVLTRLSELMFIDVLRRYIETLPPERAGWLAGIRDPVVGKALSLLHEKPARDWTIEELARGSGASRSVLAERFTQLVGIPPIAYLAKWRMQLAAEMLARGAGNIAGIAAEIGYDSEASFSRAFKKLVGVPPSQWRRR
ncbi:MAG TPA: AraC family transcriptional regulator [Bauldia sp.]|nr:AraC family transcriptional regulator [Bauldia sp.]